MTDDWITTDKAVLFSGYDIQHVRRLLREKKVKGKKWGREWMVDRNSLLAYLESKNRAVNILPKNSE